MLKQVLFFSVAVISVFYVLDCNMVDAIYFISLFSFWLSTQRSFKIENEISIDWRRFFSLALPSASIRLTIWQFFKFRRLFYVSVQIVKIHDKKKWISFWRLINERKVFASNNKFLRHFSRFLRRKDDRDIYKWLKIASNNKQNVPFYGLCDSDSMWITFSSGDNPFFLSFSFFLYFKNSIFARAISPHQLP